MGVSLLCMVLAKKILKTQYPNVELQPDAIVLFETDDLANEANRALAEALNLDISSHGDVFSFPRYVEQLLANYPIPGRKSLIVTGPPCLVTSNCNDYAVTEEKTALHTGPTNAVWPIHEALNKLCRSCGPNSTGHFCEHTKTQDMTPGSLIVAFTLRCAGR